ncbi:DUF2892 domain-containing protein [Caldibacillus lycopersici]|uniref:DUF2892 domain-containing protein n=1 Tax=Perspicuibacillus lycopersici TaxID=1325689 RepID=A0AAE3IVT1_9BACI|nr:DUF2892 domain-containing protein [Perspicuibacillus lycopersici]MCU9614301.1 DUF2892 domain-containing protein [Perspicuibacillus lycopersici]
MNVKPNIGIVNALIRITAGLTLLSWCTAKLVKKPWRSSYIFLAAMGAMKVAEGIVRYCPVTEAVQNYTQNHENKENKPQLKQLIDTFVSKQANDSLDQDSSNASKSPSQNYASTDDSQKNKDFTPSESLQ